MMKQFNHQNFLTDFFIENLVSHAAKQNIFSGNFRTQKYKRIIKLLPHKAAIKHYHKFMISL